MAWSITAVARMSKVTSRTLRHYDAIGLLAPAYVGANGYRYYEQEQLLRLQEILLLRELGLSLEAIAEVIDGERDRVEALRRHESWLRAEAARLSHMAGTVSRTIARLEGEQPMSAEELFEGFAEKQAGLQTMLVGRHGEVVKEHFRSADAHAKNWTKADYLAVQAEGEALDRKVAAVMASGAAPGSGDAQAVIAEHYRSVARFWTPGGQSYTGLGRLYVEDPDFKARYDALAPGLAEYLRDAIAVYAARHLS